MPKMQVLPDVMQIERDASRDQFACAALQVLMEMSRGFLNDSTREAICKDAFAWADEMMKARGLDIPPVVNMPTSTTPTCTSCGYLMPFYDGKHHCVNETCPQCNEYNPTVEEPDVRPACGVCRHLMNFDVGSGWFCPNPKCGEYE